MYNTKVMNVQSAKRKKEQPHHKKKKKERKRNSILTGNYDFF